VDIESATGIRVLVPASGLGGGGTAIDELEVYGSPIPEPTSAVLALLAAGGWPKKSSPLRIEAVAPFVISVAFAIQNVGLGPASNRL